MSIEESKTDQYTQLSFGVGQADGSQNHPLTQIEPREEGGVTAEFKSGYQKELATLSCIAMLFPENNIRSVAVELHEDYVVEYSDGSFNFKQVKHKDEGEMVSFSTLSSALYNLYLQYQKFTDPQNRFTLECNLGAHSGSRGNGNLFELKKILTKSHNMGLDPVDENRLTLLKNSIIRLQDFADENAESVGEFIDRLTIATNLGDVDAIKEKTKSKITEYLCLQNRTTTIDTKMCDAFYDNVYLIVDRASRERVDRSKRIINTHILKKAIPSIPNLAELSDPISPHQEYSLLIDIDPKHTILEHKCITANIEDVIEILTEAKILARNRNDHYRANTPALNYINHLRRSINHLDKDEKLKARKNNRQQDHIQSYLDVMDRLQIFARDERQNDISVRVDFEYLRGLYAQLVSECPITP